MAKIAVCQTAVSNPNTRERQLQNTWRQGGEAARTALLGRTSPQVPHQETVADCSPPWNFFTMWSTHAGSTSSAPEMSICPLIRLCNSLIYWNCFLNCCHQPLSCPLPIANQISLLILLDLAPCWTKSFDFFCTCSQWPYRIWELLVSEFTMSSSQKDAFFPIRFSGSISITTTLVPFLLPSVPNTPATFVSSLFPALTHCLCWSHLFCLEWHSPPRLRLA